MRLQLARDRIRITDWSICPLYCLSRQNGHRNALPRSLPACAVPRSCQNTKLRPLLDGAPNFRQVEGLPVYGVAIPTVRGLRNVLDELGAANGERGSLRGSIMCWPQQQGPMLQQ